MKKNRAAFVAPHNGGDNDSLSVMRRYFESNGGYDIVSISTQDLKLDTSSIGLIIKSCLKAAGFFTFKAFLLATSQYVFLNDNFMPMASLNFSKKAVVTQLWHAEGAFKKFGLSAPVTDEVREREKRCSEKLTYIVCSSKAVAPFYAEAFGVDIGKLLPVGSARIDSLLAPTDTAKLRSDFDKAHPECVGKELVLYNVHLSAYGGSDEIRTAQMTMLFNDMKAEYEKGNYTVCGGDFNHDFTGDSNKYFKFDDINCCLRV